VLEGGDTHYPSVGTGIAYPQSAAAPAFSGDYGLRFTQELEGSENDGTGQWNANSTTTPPSLSGAADVNISGANQDQPFTGTFAAPTAATPFPGTLLGTTNNTVSSAVFSPQITVDYYFIDASHGFFIETDLLTRAHSRTDKCRSDITPSGLPSAAVAIGKRARTRGLSSVGGAPSLTNDGRLLLFARTPTGALHCEI